MLIDGNTDLSNPEADVKLRNVQIYDHSNYGILARNAYIKGENVDETAPLFEDGLGMDSIAIVEFILMIEERFNIQFLESELNPEMFSNLDSLAKLIATKTVI